MPSHETVRYCFISFHNLFTASHSWQRWLTNGAPSFDRPVYRAECVALDDHLKTYNIGESKCLEAWALTRQRKGGRESGKFRLVLNFCYFSINFCSCEDPSL